MQTFMFPYFKLAASCLGSRDLARTSSASLLDRQFPENFIFEKANFSMKNFQF